jgi:hypothetical protein
MDSKERATQKFKLNNPNYMIDYYQQNKQKFKEKIDCTICGGKYAYSNKNKHNNSKKHIKKLTPHLAEAVAHEAVVEN